MLENDLSYIIRGLVFKIHAKIGPGLLESAYEAALAYELKKSGLQVRTQVGLPFQYDDIQLDIGYRVDIIVNEMVIIEVKSVETLLDVHYKQLLTYLKLSDKKLGLLINFNTADMNDSIKRIVNKL